MAKHLLLKDGRHHPFSHFYRALSERGWTARSTQYGPLVRAMLTSPSKHIGVLPWARPQPIIFLSLTRHHTFTYWSFPPKFKKRKVLPAGHYHMNSLTICTYAFMGRLH